MTPGAHQFVKVAAPTRMQDSPRVRSGCTCGWRSRAASPNVAHARQVHQRHVDDAEPHADRGPDRAAVLSAVKLAESAELLTAVKIVNLLREKSRHRAADLVADHFLPRGGTP